MTDLPAAWLAEINAVLGPPRVAVPDETRISGGAYRRCWVWFPNGRNHNVGIDRTPGGWTATASGARGQAEWSGRTEPTDDDMLALCRLAGVIPTERVPVADYTGPKKAFIVFRGGATDSIDLPDQASADSVRRMIERWRTNPSGRATIYARNGSVDVRYADIADIYFEGGIR